MNLKKIKLPRLDSLQPPYCSYAIGLGFEPHYSFFEANRQIFKATDKFWLYDKSKVDIINMMRKYEKMKMTYITPIHFETVEAISSEFKTINSNLALNYYLNTCRLVIKHCYIDVHPLESYIKICGYLNVKLNQKYVKMFMGSFALEDLPNQTLMLPLMTKLRQKYLDTSNLKLKRLQRKQIPIKQEINQVLQKWISLVQGLNIINQQKQIQQQQLLYSGQQVSFHQLVEGLGRRYYYGSWS